MSEARLLLPVGISSSGKHICLEGAHLHQHHFFHGELPGKELAAVLCCTLEAMLLSVGAGSSTHELSHCFYQHPVLQAWPSQCVLLLETAFFVTCTGCSHSSTVLSSGIDRPFPPCIISVTPQQVHICPSTTAAHIQPKLSC